MSYRNYSVANGRLVDVSGNGDFTTIQAAITAASAGDTIYVKSKSTPYQEDLTLKDGVNLVATTLDPLVGDVIIKGNITTPTVGSFGASLYGFGLQTNAGNQITIGGSNAVALFLDNCWFSTADHDQISMTNSSALLEIRYSKANLTDGFKFFTITAGIIQFNWCGIASSATYTTASTISGGTIGAQFSELDFPVTTSGTAAFNYSNCTISLINTKALIIGGSGNGQINRCAIATGSATAITATTLVFMRGKCTVTSSNVTAAIDGAGTLTISDVDWIGTSTITTAIVNKQPSTIGDLTVLNAVATPSITINGGTALTVFSQGTFNPTIRGTGTAGTVTMTNQGGRWQKIGRYVTVTIDVDWTTLGGATGGVQCNNLPFTCVNTANAENMSACTGHNNPLVTVAGAMPFTEPVANTTTTTVYYYTGAAGGNTLTTITATNGLTTTLTYETT